MNAVLKRLEPADAAAFHALRLEALLRHPAWFRATWEEQAALGEEEMARRLAEQAVFGALVEGELRGIAGFAQARQAKKRHKGELWGVYVRPVARGEGLGTALVGAVIEHARGRVVQLHATVAVTNRPARRLYRKLGFEPYGLEPRGLRIGRRYVDQELMMLPLDDAGLRRPGEEPAGAARVSPRGGTGRACAAVQRSVEPEAQNLAHLQER